MNNFRKAVSLARNGRYGYLFQKMSFRLGIVNPFIRNPSIVMIEPTNVCNLKCPTCPTGAGMMNRPRTKMRSDEFQRIIDQIKGYAQRIVLWNYGEPFLNDELLSMIRYATDRKIFVETSTNGEFFKSRDFCHDIVGSGLQKLIVCLDGADQETIIKFRKGSHFNRIKEGIELMVKAKKELNSKTPEIEFQFIVMKHNEHQKPYMKKLAAEMGVDIYCEKTVGIDSSAPNFQSLARELLPADLSLSRFYQKEDGTFALKGEFPNYCWRIFQSVVINSNGTVVPCCYDLYSNHVMGNIFEDSLENIWRNKRYARFRRRLMLDRKSIPMCNICSEGRCDIRRRDHVS